MAYQTNRQHPALSPKAYSSYAFDIEFQASIEIVKLWTKKLRKSNNFRSVVFAGLIAMVIESFAFLIFGAIYMVSQGTDFFRDGAILFISFRAVLYLTLVFIPHVFFSMNLDTIQNSSDKKAFERFCMEPTALLNPTWYYTPGYLYDTRDARNRRDVGSLLFYVAMMSIVFCALLGHGIHRVHNSSSGDFSSYDTDDVNDIITMYNISETDAIHAIREYTLNTYLLPMMSTLSITAAFEVVLILTTFHAFHRRATPPPLSFFKTQKQE